MKQPKIVSSENFSEWTPYNLGDSEDSDSEDSESGGFLNFSLNPLNTSNFSYAVGSTGAKLSNYWGSFFFKHSLQSSLDFKSFTEQYRREVESSTDSKPDKYASIRFARRTEFWSSFYK